MLTRGEQRTVNSIVQTCCITALFPLDWDSKTNRMSVTPSRFKLCFVSFSFTILMIYTFFLIHRLLPGNGYSEGELKSISLELMVHYFWTFVHFTCGFMQFSFSRYCYDFATLFNQLNLFNSNAGPLSE